MYSNDGSVTSPYLDAIEPEAADALPLDDPNRACDEGATVDHEQCMGDLITEDDDESDAA